MSDPKVKIIENLTGWEARRLADEKKVRYRDSHFHWHQWDDPSPVTVTELNRNNWAIEEELKDIYTRRESIDLMIKERTAFDSVDEAIKHGIAPDQLILLREVRE